MHRTNERSSCCEAAGCPAFVHDRIPWGLAHNAPNLGPTRTVRFSPSVGLGQAKESVPACRWATSGEEVWQVRARAT